MAIDRLLLLANFDPLEKSIGRDQAPAPLDGGAERGFLRHRLAAGVDERGADFRIFRPTGNQSPPHLRQLAACGGLTNDRNLLRRRNVVAQRQLPLDLRREVKVPRYFGRRGSQGVTATHFIYSGAAPPLLTDKYTCV